MPAALVSHALESGVETYGSPPVSCMFGIHLVIVVHRFFVVPGHRQLQFFHSFRETYKFDGDLLVVEQICALENDTKGPFSDLLAHSVMYTNNVRRGGCHDGSGGREDR